MNIKLLLPALLILVLFSCKKKESDPAPIQKVQYNIHVNNSTGSPYSYTISSTLDFTAIGKNSVNRSLSFTVVGTDGPVCYFYPGATVYMISTDIRTSYTIYKSGKLMYSSSSYSYQFTAN